MREMEKEKETEKMERTQRMKALTEIAHVRSTRKRMEFEDGWGEENEKEVQGD